MVARRSILSKNHDGGPAPYADSLLLVSEWVRMDLIKSLSFPPTFLRWRGAHGSGMVVVPPPVIAFDWLAWRGVAWCHTIDSCLQPHLLFSTVVWRAMAPTASFPLSGVNIASALAGNSLLMPMESDTSYNKAEWAISAWGHPRDPLPWHSEMESKVDPKIVFLN